MLQWTQLRRVRKVVRRLRGTAKENGRRGRRRHRRAFQVHLAGYRKLFLVSADGGQQARFGRIGFVAIEPLRAWRPRDLFPIHHLSG
jgi:hypothetical protein